MDDVGLIVATMTLARDEAEELTILRAFHHLARPGRRIVATDGGSRKPFLREMARLPGVTLLEPGFGRGLLAQVQTSLSVVQALSAPLLLYTEPDKGEFFAERLDAFLEAATPKLDEAGVVLAGRDAASFATYPAIQQVVEREVNDACALATGQAGDYCYGPFLLRRELLPHVLAVPEDVGWGWRPYLFARAHRLGLGVHIVHAGHPCPDAQRVDDDAERAHRGRQLDQNLHGLRLATMAPPRAWRAAM